MSVLSDKLEKFKPLVAKGETICQNEVCLVGTHAPAFTACQEQSVKRCIHAYYTALKSLLPPRFSTR